MIANPEFRRNLWYEFSATKVTIGLTLVLLILVAAGAIDWSIQRNRVGAPMVFPILTAAARWTAIILVLMWGGRQGAGTVIREVRGRTWDSQRMSTLRPWTMAWGKLFGGTSLCWILTLAALVVHVVAGSFSEPIGGLLLNAAIVIAAGLLCAALGMLFSLLRLTSRPGERGGNITLIHFCSLAAVLAIYYAARSAAWADARWYGIDFTAGEFAALSLWFFAIWSVIGVYRRMGRELQVRNRRPWVWLLFLLSMILYAFGYVADLSSVSLKILLPGLILWLFTLVLTLAEAKDLVLLRKVFRDLGRGRLLRAVSDGPLIVVTALLFLVVQAATIVILAFTPDHGSLNFLGVFLGEIAFHHSIALLLFAIRDVMIVWMFVLSRDGSLAEAYGFVTWFVLYGPVPVLIFAARQFDLLAVTYPTGMGGFYIGILPVLVIAVGCLIFVIWRWRRFWRQGGPKRPVPKKSTPAADAAAA